MSGVELINDTIRLGSEIIWIPFGISIFGMVGNLITFLTIIFTDLRKNSISASLLVLVCSDSVFLLDFFLQPLLRLDTSSFWHCFLTEYSFNTPIFVSCGAIVLLTLERFFGVVCPLEYTKHSHRINRWALLWCWFFLALLLNFNLLFILRDTDQSSYRALVASSTDKKPRCEYDATAKWANLYSVPKLLFTFLLPLFMLVLVNATIIWKLRGRSKRRNIPSSSANSRLLLIMPSVFVTLHLPFNLISFLTFISGPVTMDIIYRDYYWSYTLSLYLYCLNFASNFVVYVLTSPVFRKEFTQLWIKRFTTSPQTSSNDVLLK